MIQCSRASLLQQRPACLGSSSSSSSAARHAAGRLRSVRCRAQAVTTEQLMGLCKEAARGTATTPEQLAQIEQAVAELERRGAGSTTTGPDLLSATWRLLWTTEKETLWILQNAGLFGTEAGEVYQVIDVEGRSLQNVIEFPPEGAFIVDSSIDIADPQRVEFKFNAAKLRLPAGRSLPFPPFGQGWFRNVYVDQSIRVAKDSRGDTLIVQRAGPPRRFS